LRKKQSEFFKLQMAAITGSLLDYLITILGVEIFHFWYLGSAIVGNISGGVLQFILNKKWVFTEAGPNTRRQAGRFVLVFAGNIILSALGVYLLTSGLHINYIFSKTIISILLGLTYNYFLQQRFVFP
jgi:putative flippase GtrA